MAEAGAIIVTQHSLITKARDVFELSPALRTETDVQLIQSTHVLHSPLLHMTTSVLLPSSLESYPINADLFKYMHNISFYN